jgi:hypothetical protein
MLAVHFRDAVRILQGAFHMPLEDEFLEVFGPRWRISIVGGIEEPIQVRAAWALVNVCILARLAGAASRELDFVEAEAWFFGKHDQALPSLARSVASRACTQALECIRKVRIDEDLLELFPYILEPHGPGSRLSVMRDSRTNEARKAKKRRGVFYTPADVADFMVRSAIAEHPDLGNLRCLDPSCGTGVFLLALLQELARRNGQDSLGMLIDLSHCIFGIDVSSLTVENCAFVMMARCLEETRQLGLAPWTAWHLIRLNLAVADSISIAAPVSGECISAAAERVRIRKELLLNKLVIPTVAQNPDVETLSPGFLWGDTDRTPLGVVFPEVADGFDVLVANPPYAPLGKRDDNDWLARQYDSLGGQRPASGANAYPLFVEMMWRLTRPGKNSSALVVPLSIAYHGGEQFRACRRAIALHGGHWRFAFFDREPHALFGEDVKTRSAILLRTESEETPQRGNRADIETGGLRKCTSRTRHRLFETIGYTALSNLDIVSYIPKLGSTEQLTCFRSLVGRREKLRTFWNQSFTCLPADASSSLERPTVFLASTAYNFLNVFRSLTLDRKQRVAFSENNVHGFECASQKNAEILFAILSSRLVFWLWHVQGDGFHVGRSFAEAIPFGPGSFDQSHLDALAGFGRCLWQAVQAHRIVSLNKGRRTVAFRPLACENERDGIDHILIEAARLPKRFSETLRTFVQTVVVVDETDQRRGHLKTLFNVPEKMP